MGLERFLKGFLMFCLILGFLLIIGSFTLYFSSCDRADRIDPTNDEKLIDADIKEQYKPAYLKRLSCEAIEANLSEGQIIYVVSYLMYYENENRIFYFVASVKPCDPEHDINGDGWDVDTEIILYGED